MATTVDIVRAARDRIGGATPLGVRKPQTFSRSDAAKLIDSVDAYVGQRVRGRRLELKLSQSDVAEALDVTFQQLQKYEKGINRISCSTLAKLADVLAAPVSFFFDGAPGYYAGERPLTAGDEMMQSREGVTIAHAFVSIKNPHLRQCIAGFLEQVASRREHG